jgi:hypothetical protein
MGISHVAGVVVEHEWIRWAVLSYPECGAAEKRRQMIRELLGKALPTLLCFTLIPAEAFPQSNLPKIKSEHEAVSSSLQKHLVFDWWLDDAPESPELLRQQWTLEGEWVAAWLNEHSSEDVKAAVTELVPGGEPEYQKLYKDTFLVVAPNVIGNVFVVAKRDGKYRLAWSTAQVQKASGQQAEILAAWRPENARHGRRGPYFASSGSTGSVTGRIGKLPEDGKGHPRFYIDGTYAQSAGGTVGAQISVWVWNGKSPEPLIAKAYAFMIDQAVGTRVEGDLLRVQEKKFFRSFFSCGACEERQTDWTIRLTPDGIEDLGEKSVVPELDAVDELFYRVIHHESAADVAAPGVIVTAEKIVGEARAGHSEKDWEQFPTLGMMGKWDIQEKENKKILCLSLDDAGTNLFALKSMRGRPLIVDLKETNQDCSE